MSGPDLSVKNIARLHARAMAQNDDLYTFLLEEFPDLPVEERLKYLAAILNDHFDDYRFDEADELRHDGYIVKRFYPKKR
ncbi:hypothetical protein [Hydrogenimonas sp.]